jgi:paraquat-inducible protein B
MSQKFSPTLIGAFVSGAIGVFILAIIAFGSGRLFQQTKEFVIYFSGTVNGLRIGAPVKFKGVEIGSVKDIRLQLEDAQVTKIPVLVEIDMEKLTSRGASGAVATDSETFHQAIVQRGLRAQMLMESLVTGLLYVGLDLFPGTPVQLVQQPGGKHRYPEIPTTPTTLEQAQDAATRIIAKIEEIDFKSLVQTLTETVDGVNHLVNSKELKSSLRSLEQTMPKLDDAVVGIRKAVATIDGSVAGLSENFGRTSDATRRTMEQAEQTLKQSEGILKSAEMAMVNVRSASDPESGTFYEISRSLREISAAARSLRLLASSIERNPRSLIFGKPETQERQ